MYPLNMPWWSELVIDDAYWAQYGPTLTIQELSQITRRSTVTVWRWLLEGKLPGHGIAGGWIVYTEVLQRELEKSLDPADASDARSTGAELPVEFLSTFSEELTVADVARLLGKKKETIYRWLGANELPAHRLGRAWILNKTEFVQLLEQTYKKSPRKP